MAHEKQVLNKSILTFNLLYRKLKKKRKKKKEKKKKKISSNSYFLASTPNKSRRGARSVNTFKFYFIFVQISVPIQIRKQDLKNI